MGQDPLGLGGGCSALSWHTEDGCHLWGRNYDFDRLAQGAGMTFLPRGGSYPTAPGEPPSAAQYACAGVGLALSPTPVLYEGVNEQGLMGGQLYYRGFARYAPQARPGTQALQPPYLVYHVLAQCASVEEAAQLLQARCTLVDVPLLGAVPPLHWSFSDKTGETLVAEPDEGGLRLYRRTLGVMTNSPGYPWHRLNLLNYAGIRAQDYPTVEFPEEVLEQCFSGSGAQGLPGDWSSPSRFVRLAFLRRHALPGRDEGEGVGRMFRLLQSAAFPLGLVEVSHQSAATALDRDVLPYDFTVYTAVYCAESQRAYWTTYEDQCPRCLRLSALVNRREPFTLPLSREWQAQDATPNGGHTPTLIRP